MYFNAKYNNNLYVIRDTSHLIVAHIVKKQPIKIITKHLWFEYHKRADLHYTLALLENQLITTSNSLYSPHSVIGICFAANAHMKRKARFQEITFHSHVLIVSEIVRNINTFHYIQLIKYKIVQFWWYLRQQKFF